MNNEELEQEVEAIQAIFEDCLERLGPGIISVKIPNHEDFTAQLAFPTSYPDEMPSLIQVVTHNGVKYPDDRYLCERVQGILERVYVPSEVVMYELISEIGAYLDAYEEERQAVLQTRKKDTPEPITEPLPEDKKERPEKLEKTQNSTEGWVQSEPIVDRALTFLAFAREVHSTEEARRHISILTQDKRISRAAHNMVAMRISGENGVQYQDCDDDGETAAGLRMLHLLTIMDVRNVVVVVSRWFGGIHLGSARFKHINSATRDALTRGGFCVEKKKK